MRDHRSALGTALVTRADDVASGVLTKVWPNGAAAVDEDVMEAITDTVRVATRLIGRWLIGGEDIDEDERRRLAALGGMIDRVGLDDLVKAYLAWRDVLLAVVDEEAARLGTPSELIAEVRTVVSRNNDGSIVRMARCYEEERRVLHTELEAERVKLADWALHDPLTGLPNRLLLFDRIEHALRCSSRDGRTLAILFVDLDGFKTINDRFGHDAGDRVLVAVAERLRETSRAADTVARLGGDEFVVLCGGVVHVQAATAVARRIIAALRRPFSLGDTEVTISGSVGIAVAGGGEHPGDLLVRADTAMYAAKRCGPGRHELAVASGTTRGRPARSAPRAQPFVSRSAPPA